MLSWGLDRYRRQHPTKPDPSLTQSVCGGIAGHLVPTDILYQLSSLGHFFPSLVRLACRSLDRRTITSRTAELESMLPKGNWTTSRVPLLYALSLLSSTDLQHHSSGAETAIPWLIQSAESGNGRAAYILGRISEESGTNVSGSEREWYSRSAAAGNPWGLAKLGCLLKSTELTRGLAQPLRAGLDERDRERGQADKLMSAAWVNGFVVDPGMGMGMGMGNLPPLDGKFAGAGAAGQPKNGSHSAQNTSHNGNQPPAQSLHDLLLPSTYPFSALSPTSLSLSAFSPSSPNNPEHLAFSVPGAGTLPSVLDPVGRRWIRHLPLDPSDIGSYIVPFPSITPSSVATEWLGTGVQSVEVGRGRARGSPIVPSNWLGGLVWGWGGVGNQSIGSANKEKDKPSNQNDWPACGVATEAQASDAPRGKGALPSPSPIRKGSTSSAGGTAVAQSSSASPSSDDGLPATPVRADEDRHLKDPDYASGSAQQHVLKPPLAAAAPRNVNSTVPQPPQLPSDSPVDPPSKIASVASDEEGTKKKTKLYRSPSHHRRSGGISTDDEGDASATNRFARSKKPVKGKQVLGKRTLMSRLRDTDVLAGASSPSASGGNVAAAGSTAVAGNSPAGWHTGSIAPSNVAINPHLQSAFLLLSSLAFSTHYSTAPPNLSSPLDLSNQLPAPLLRPLPAQLSTLVLSSPQQRTKTILTFAMARNEFLEAHRIALSFEDPVRSLYGYYRGFTTDPSAFRNAGIAECLVCAVVCFYACVYSSARLHSEVASGDGARSRKGGNPSAGGTTAPLTGERKPYYGPEVGRMAETVLCYLMDNCAGWPAEYTLWKWSNRTKLEAVPKSQAPSPAAELQRDQARIDSEAVFESSLLMKLGGWEKFRLAYEELGKVISKTSSGSDNGDGPTVSGRTKGATNSLPANEVDRLVERERQRLARYEALYLRGVCGLQLVGAFEASMAQRNASTSPADALREHPPLVLQPLKKDLKAKQKEQQMYWATAAADLEAYVREAGPDGKVGIRPQLESGNG